MKSLLGPLRGSSNVGIIATVNLKDHLRAVDLVSLIDNTAACSTLIKGLSSYIVASEECTAVSCSDGSTLAFRIEEQKM